MNKNFFKYIKVVYTVLLTVLVSLAFFKVTYACDIIGWGALEGSSMNHNTNSEKNGLTVGVSYDLINGDVQRYDVISFTAKNGDTYVKRVYGLPGEHFVYDHGNVYINGVLMEDSYGHYFDENFCREYVEFYIGEGEYVVLGDNRHNSLDSREFGPISKDVIKTKNVILDLGH